MLYTDSIEKLEHLFLRICGADEILDNSIYWKIAVVLTKVECCLHNELRS